MSKARSKPQKNVVCMLTESTHLFWCPPCPPSWIPGYFKDVHCGTMSLYRINNLLYVHRGNRHGIPIIRTNRRALLPCHLTRLLLCHILLSPILLSNGRVRSCGLTYPTDAVNQTLHLPPSLSFLVAAVSRNCMLGRTVTMLIILPPTAATIPIQLPTLPNKKHGMRGMTHALDDHRILRVWRTAYVVKRYPLGMPLSDPV
jgi:hypothetical protein